MAINNIEWVGPPKTAEYIRALEERINTIENALRSLGVSI